MDDHRFDSLAKALAEGKSRRRVLKGLLGLGGAALAGSVALDGDSEAARRPANPTPTPVRCPGGQTYNPVTKKCDCPVGLVQCAPNGGPACCNSSVPVGPGYSECCDNACCFWPNDCVGEELCCPRLPEIGCLDARGACCATLCEETPGGPVCCPVEDFCPGGTESPDRCCTGNETCCGGGTNDNYCADFSTGGCCDADDCPPPGEGECGIECVARQCEPTICPEGQICCQGDCVSSESHEACPVDPEECCSTADGFICCGTDGCCLSTHCNEINGDCCASEAAVCRVEGGCCTPPQECCLGETCCDPGNCTTSGDCCGNGTINCEGTCCPEDMCLDGLGCCPDGFVACGGSCCNTDGNFCDENDDCVCNPGTEPCSQLPGDCCLIGQCNDDFFCCPANTTPCGVDCCDDATESCSANGICECTAQCCGTDTSRCELIGLDPECVTCFQGMCSDAGMDFEPCTVGDDDGEGFCSTGVCEPCLPEGAECTQFQECCNNQGYECSGGFCTS